MGKDAFNISIVERADLGIVSKDLKNNRYKCLKVIKNAQVFISLALLVSIVFESKEKKSTLLYFALLFNRMLSAISFFQFMKILERISNISLLKSHFLVYFLNIIDYFVSSVICLNNREFWIMLDRKMVLHIGRVLIFLEIISLGALKLIAVYLLVKTVFFDGKEKNKITLLEEQNKKNFFAIFTTFSYIMIFDIIYIVVIPIFILKFTHLKLIYMEVYVGSIGGIMLSCSAFGFVIGISLVVYIYKG